MRVCLIPQHRSAEIDPNIFRLYSSIELALHFVDEIFDALGFDYVFSRALIVDVAWLRFSCTFENVYK